MDQSTGTPGQQPDQPAPEAPQQPAGWPPQQGQEPPAQAALPAQEPPRQQPEWQQQPAQQPAWPPQQPAQQQGGWPQQQPAQQPAWPQQQPAQQPAWPQQQPAQPPAWPQQQPPQQPGQQPAWPQQQPAQQQAGWPEQQAGAAHPGSTGSGTRIALLALCLIAIVVSSAALVVSISGRSSPSPSPSSSLANCESRIWRASLSTSDLPSGWAVREVDPVDGAAWAELRTPETTYLNVELICTNGDGKAFFDELRAEASKDGLTTYPVAPLADDVFMRQSNESSGGSYVEGYWRRGDVVGTISWYQDSSQSTDAAATMRTTLTDIMSRADKKLAATK